MGVHKNSQKGPTPRPFSPEDVERLLHMRDVLKMRWYLIDRALGRGNGISFQKYSQLKTPLGISVSSRVAVPPEKLAERDARIAATSRMTPTATFFGDPPPGYSALDRKQSETLSPTIQLSHLKGNPSLQEDSVGGDCHRYMGFPQVER